MFLKKYWKSNLFFILIIFFFTLFDVYVNNYPMSIYTNLSKDYFWINLIAYIGIYSIIDLVIFLFKTLSKK
ncbi:hypothetical protein BBH51_09330 [Aggregatibacter actinomycetemcomitans]|nr:hypothetical protein ACT75_09120 [Aggregatibacter actinomycetemcomitans]KYK83225.1 hypothetical protein SA3033_08215 [Aggregatibacter actinomycetemcomitans serotype d str. SA3033]KYK84402.1 hypothetical protein SA2200_10820 [Aggregatibacter actinomycetemcomitans serotype d str. SA2200]ANU82836.1 hypothetical protein BBH51_09330 [Aggregatibacter actinomycetemcomitans]TYA20208.1 hypothetical protein FXE08_11215 [Aggregatibacter actinomycetemcomitans]